VHYGLPVRFYFSTPSHALTNMFLASHVSTHSANPLALRIAQREREEEGEEGEEDMPPQKRFVTHAARAQQGPIGFDPSWTFGPEPTE